MRFCCKRLHVSRGYAPLHFLAECHSLRNLWQPLFALFDRSYHPHLLRCWNIHQHSLPKWPSIFVVNIYDYICIYYKYIFWHEHIKMQMPINMVNTSLMTWEFWHLFTRFLPNMNMHQKHAQINPEPFCHVLESKSPKTFQRQPLHIFAPYLPGNELLQVTPKFSSKNQLRA